MQIAYILVSNVVLDPNYDFVEFIQLKINSLENLKIIQQKKNVNKILLKNFFTTKETCFMKRTVLIE